METHNKSWNHNVLSSNRLTVYVVTVNPKILPISFTEMLGCL